MKNPKTSQTLLPIHNHTKQRTPRPMTPAPDNIEEHLDPNALDTIIDQLKANDDDAVSLRLQQLHAAEIAGLLESLPPELRQHLWKLLPVGIEGETLAYLGEEVRGSIIGEMAHAEVVAATETMEVEDLADVMDELPDDISDAVLKSLDEDRRRRLEATLSFAEGTAGRLMTTDVISVRANVTLAVVLRYLRRLKPLPLHTDTLMVINEHGTYQGKLPLADLVAEQRPWWPTPCRKRPIR